MNVGFTGTRKGMTEAQKQAFWEFLERTRPDSFAHGDCVGADDDAARLVQLFNLEYEGRHLTRVVCHPPADESLRAFNHAYHEKRPALTHFARNRAIVDECDLLVATPPIRPMPSHGGTSYTVSYALKKGKPVLVLWPDGTCQEQTNDSAATNPWTPGGSP